MSARGHCEVRITRRYSAGPDEVWQALTDHESLGRRLARTVDVQYISRWTRAFERLDGELGA